MGRIVYLPAAIVNGSVTYGYWFTLWEKEGMKAILFPDNQHTILWTAEHTVNKENS